jgi:hypothetical protein
LEGREALHTLVAATGKKVHASDRHLKKIGAAKFDEVKYAGF